MTTPSASATSSTSAPKAISYAAVAAASKVATPSSGAASSSSSSSSTASANGSSGAGAATVKDDKTSSDYYFDGYSHFGIHEEMLKDRVRTRAYMRAIVKSPQVFKGKTVLDIGCGTGVLSMFAAQAGAKHVYAIERANIALEARKIIKANKFDKVITVIHGKVEEIELPVPQVDIIISEWMGYFLLFESMFDSVIYARDKWLAPGGMLFPDKATLFICAAEDAQFIEEKVEYWDNVYGFNMSCMKKSVLNEPAVDMCPSDSLISSPKPILDMDLPRVDAASLDFSSPFELTISRNEYLQALCCYFSIDFLASTEKVFFSTGPRQERTHWKNTLFYLDEPIRVNKDDTVKGSISVKRNDRNPRNLDITLVVQHAPSNTNVTKHFLFR